MGVYRDVRYVQIGLRGITEDKRTKPREFGRGRSWGSEGWVVSPGTSLVGVPGEEMSCLVSDKTGLSFRPVLNTRPLRPIYLISVLIAVKLLIRLLKFKFTRSLGDTED